MTEHTPGPWTVEDNLPGREGEVWVHAANATDPYDHVVVCVGDMETIDGRDLVNAGLIAAAPDLLATLSGLLAAIDETEPDSTWAVCHWQALARAAVAKATGDIFNTEPSTCPHCEERREAEKVLVNL